MRNDRLNVLVAVAGFGCFFLGWAIRGGVGAALLVVSVGCLITALVRLLRTGE